MSLYWKQVQGYRNIKAATAPWAKVVHLDKTCQTFLVKFPNLENFVQIHNFYIVP